MRPEHKAPAWPGLPGRQWILETLAHTFANLEEPTAPLLLTLRGSPGSGKTAALRALRAALEMVPTPCLGLWDAYECQAAELLAQIEETLGRVPPGQLGVLLVDNLDALLWKEGSEPFVEFERRVAHPLAQRQAVVLVATSRVDLPWREYAVRVHHKTCVLAALTAADVALVTEKWEMPAQEAYARTLGHPWTLEQLRQDLNRSAAELASRAAEYFLADLPPETTELTRMASLTLVFDVALLRELLPSRQADDSDGYYLEQIRRMRQTGLVNWQVGVGYRFFDSAVRRLLARSLFYRSSRRFEEFHAQAWDYYQDIAKGTSFLPYSLVSAVYHRAQMYHALGTPPEDAGKRCAEWVEDSVAQWKGAKWGDVVAVWESGMGDRLIREELIELLGEKMYHQILKTLRHESTHQGR